MIPSLLADITVGDHITRKLFGLTIDFDTVYTTLIASAIVLGLGFYMRFRASVAKPGRMQLAYETIVGGVEDQVQGTIGDAGRPIVPLALTLFLLILIANWVELIPSGHNPEYLPAPSSDVNFTFALSIFVILMVHATWLRHQGLKKYVGHYFRPMWALFPINVIEEITKPITLALRLFGNIFGGAMLVVIIAGAIPAHYFVPIPVLDMIWKIFDGLFVGPLQAFIFTLLTIVYFEAPIAGGH